MAVDLYVALKLCKEWTAFTLQLPLIDTVITFHGLDWKQSEDYDSYEYLTVMTADGQFMQWMYTKNGTLQGHKTNMDQRRLQGLKPILEDLQRILDEDQHYTFCEGGHLVPRDLDIGDDDQSVQSEHFE